MSGALWAGETVRAGPAQVAPGAGRPPAPVAAALLRDFVFEKSRNLLLLREFSRLQQRLSDAARETARLSAELARAREPCAAARPPALVLSTHRLFRHRQFAVHLVAARGWLASHGVTPQMLREAASRATTRLEAEPDREVRHCALCCPTRPIVSVCASSPPALAAEACGAGDGGAGYERYTWDGCQSRCSSSRDHHKSRLFLRLELPLGLGVVDSQPFKCLSRDKRKDHGQGTAVKVPAAFSKLCADLPSPLPAPPAPVVSQKLFAHWKVRVYSASVGKMEIDMVAAAFRAAMQKRAGFMRYTCRLLDGGFATFLFVQSASCEAAKAGSPQAIQQFIRGGGNPIGIDLIRQGAITAPVEFHS
eukprot:m51a1_g1868 hypothetical protein (363) ;mRNA; f:658016-659412